ncbi:ATP-grasp fold amidoligase family protein [Microbacterium sp.]|uniref:ATP-grasp fold amidoligase family protein n=1 Tax=Microbacterium sp. TaxID=51671 RepID=UPI003F95E32D
MTSAEGYINRKTRIWRLLRLNILLRWVSDEAYLRLLYWSRFTRPLDLGAPKTFSEKIQWLKLYDRQPVYTRLVDKYEVKRWVAERIGESHIVPTLGVWDSFDEIDFDTLPDQFVLKCTHDSGGLVICKDRAAFDFRAARRKINRSLSRNFYRNGREWPYRDVQPRVIAEVYFPTWDPPANVQDRRNLTAADADQQRALEESVERNGVFDYKFYCFHGEPKFLYVSQGLHDHQTAKMAFLSCDWTPEEFVRPDYLHFDEVPPKPASLSEMSDLSRTLSAGIPFVRVDFFEHRGQVLFSEMTFHPVSGLMPIEPQSADYEIAKHLDLSLVGTAE